MALVVLDQGLPLGLRGAGQAKRDVDALEGRGVAAMPDGLEVDVDPGQLDPGIARPTLDEQDAAG